MTEPGRPPRDPRAVIGALTAACAAHPDQRVTQIIVNVLGEDPFYVEDDDATELLFAYAELRP